MLHVSFKRQHIMKLPPKFPSDQFHADGYAKPPSTTQTAPFQSTIWRLNGENFRVIWREGRVQDICSAALSNTSSQGTENAEPPAPASFT